MWRWYEVYQKGFSKSKITSTRKSKFIIENHSEDFWDREFRFYSITMLYEAGVDEEKISYLAGHTTCKMTQHYDRSKSIKKQVSREEMRALL